MFSCLRGRVAAVIPTCNHLFGALTNSATPSPLKITVQNYVQVNRKKKVSNYNIIINEL